jgi:hypothetical protein
MYITASASERIVDTLEFFPHNSPMPQMSSTDCILMDAQDMTDALKHPHPDFAFATIGDDTIPALEKLSEIFTRKFKKQQKSDATPEPERLHSIQQNVTPNAIILSPPIQNHIIETNPTATHFTADTQPPRRVVTPATRRVSPPKVRARAHQLSPRNLSRDFLDPQGYVRFETGRPPGKPIITKTVDTLWLLPCKTHARPMVAKYKTNIIQFGSG